MGTYIYAKGQIQYKLENLFHILEAVKKLNERDDLKRGFSYTDDGVALPHFAWMPSKYEDKIHNMTDIIEKLLGFDYKETLSSDGIMTGEFYYDNKWGQHELFFIAMAPYLEYLNIDHASGDMFESEELVIETHYWKMVLNTATKRVHTIEPRITVEWPSLTIENQTTLEDCAPIWSLPEKD